MVKEYFKNFMLSRFHIFLFTISSIVMGVELYRYIFLSGENNGVSFLFKAPLLQMGGNYSLIYYV